MDTSWWTSAGFSVLLTVISVSFTVLTGVGAAVSWWRANLSAKSKQAAENAEADAKAHLEAAKKLSAEVERLADIAAGPLYTIRWSDSGEAVLETRGEPVIVESLEGYHPTTSDTTKIPHAVPEPAPLAPDQPMTFVPVTTWGAVVATHVAVRLQGRAEPILVPLPPEPPTTWETSRQTGVR